MIYIRATYKYIPITYTTYELHTNYICNILWSTYNLQMQHTMYIWFTYVHNIPFTYDLHMRHTIYRWPTHATYIESCWYQFWQLRFSCAADSLKLHVECSRQNLNSRGRLASSIISNLIRAQPSCMHALTSTCPLELCMAWFKLLVMMSSEDISSSPMPLELHASLRGNMAPCQRYQEEWMLLHITKVRYAQY
jgi:hypothetical protein